MLYSETKYDTYTLYILYLSSIGCPGVEEV